MKKKEQNILGEDFRRAAIESASRMNDMYFSNYACHFLMVAGAMIGKTYTEENLDAASDISNPHYKESIKRDIRITLNRMNLL